MLLLMVLTARLSLGLALAALGGGLLYLVGPSAILPSFAPSPGVVHAVVLCSWGLGATVGAFPAWLNMRGGWRYNAATLGLVLAGAFSGSALGLWVGVGESFSARAAFSMGMLPWLSKVLLGATIGANLPPSLRMLLHEWLRSERRAG